MSTKPGFSQRAYDPAGDHRSGEWVNRFNTVDEDRLKRVLEAERAAIRAEFTTELAELRAEFYKMHGDQLPWLYFGFWCVITLSLLALLVAVSGPG